MAAAPPPPPPPGGGPGGSAAPPPPPPGGGPGGSRFIYDNWWPPESQDTWGLISDNQMALWLAEQGLPYERRLFRPHLGYGARDQRSRWRPYVRTVRGNALYDRDHDAPGRPWRRRNPTTRKWIPIDTSENLREYLFNNQETDDNRLPGRDNRDFTDAEWDQLHADHRLAPADQLPMDRFRDIDQKYDEDQFHNILSRMMRRAHGEASVQNLHELVPSALRLRPSAAQRVQEHRQQHAAASVARDETGPLDGGGEYTAQGQYVGAGAGPASAPRSHHRDTAGN